MDCAPIITAFANDETNMAELSAFYKSANTVLFFCLFVC